MLAPPHFLQWDMTFLEQLSAASQAQQSLLCVGLDPEPRKFPIGLGQDAAHIFDFCAAIVDATHILDGLDAWPTHVAFLARGS